MTTPVKTTLAPIAVFILTTSQSSDCNGSSGDKTASCGNGRVFLDQVYRANWNVFGSMSDELSNSSVPGFCITYSVSNMCNPSTFCTKRPDGPGLYYSNSLTIVCKNNGSVKLSGGVNHHSIDDWGNNYASGGTCVNPILIAELEPL